MNYNKTDPKSIQYLFGAIAKKYDLANLMLSFGLHHRWNRKLVENLSTPPSSTHLDLCSGTGEIALKFIKKNPAVKKIILLDFCKEMLNVAKEKLSGVEKNELEFVEADAQNLPLGSSSIDSATIAYGIRNIQNPKEAILEAFRVLKPGANFGILELTRPKNRFLKKGHHLFLKGFIPCIGNFITENKSAYQYLCDSIHHFIDPDALAEMLKEAGFVNIEIKPLNFGIASLILAHKEGK